jgi:hypothetical protein
VANKQGQQGKAGNKKQEGQGNQGFQEKAKGKQQTEPAASPRGANQRGPQPGSQKDRRGRIGL